jgi:hypothetical protein
VLGDEKAVAPFFRFPGLGRTNDVEDYLASRGLMAWSADFPADDWRRISANEVLHRALRRLEAHGKGVLLLHDIQPATALALPTLLHELKARGYRIVHVVPATADRPKTFTTASQWRLRPVRTSLPVLLANDVRELNGESFAKLTAAELCSADLPARNRHLAHRRHHKPAQVATQASNTKTAAKVATGTTGSAVNVSVVY